MLPKDIIARYRIRKGSGFRLSDMDPADTCGLDIEKEEAKTIVAASLKRLTALQERLYAEDRWAILVVLQGMDTAGKDGVIKHVMSGLNPQGCDVHSFKATSPQELDHDYLWRAAAVLPRRGHIGIFNRSYYEEVLVVRVHRELLEAQKLPPKLVGENIWKQRFEDISNFERYLGHNGIVSLKFFLHVSKEEQRKRLLARLEDPAKQWKIATSDLADRKLWHRYMGAYEDMIRHTETSDSPWHVVPADQEWFSRLVVAAALIGQLETIDPQFPKLNAAVLREIERVRAALLAEAPKKKV